jgi:hypothetical protein
VNVVGAKEIAARLGVPENTVHIWRKRGVLPKAEGTVSGMPAWNWSTITAWARARGGVTNLEAEVLKLLDTRAVQTSDIRQRLLTSRVIGSHVTIGQIWTTLNQMLEDGLLEKAANSGWHITIRGRGILRDSPAAPHEMVAPNALP